MRCEYEQCKRRVAVVIGDCKYCQHHYCDTHRLPEDHKCDGLDKCRRERFDKNREKLLKEQIIICKI